MIQRVLITYAARAGSTAEVAEEIGRVLAARGYAVEVQPIEDNPSPEGWQAVLIGSAVSRGRWLPEAVTYVQTHQPALRRKQVALFTVDRNNLGDDEQSRASRDACLEAVRRLLPPVTEVFFRGKMDPAHLPWLSRWIVRMVKSPAQNWEAIDGWAQRAPA